MGKVSTLIFRWLLAGVIAVAYSIFYQIIGPLTLRISYGILQFFTEATLEGSTILVGGTTLEFIPACAAISAYTLLWILILLTSNISFKKGLILALYGSLLILTANVIRIEVLIYVLLTWGKNYFDTLHLFIWTVVSSVYVAGVWVYLTWRYKVKSVPIYSDIIYVWKKFKNKTLK